jgi:hypothetical protein
VEALLPKLFLKMISQQDSSFNIQCVALSGDQVSKPVQMMPQTVCSWQYPGTGAIPRLADYYDPSSWQCYQHVRVLGTISSKFDNFCKFQGYIGVNMNLTGNAYDWKCMTKTHTPVGLSVSDACIWYYQRQMKIAKNIAFYALVNFNSPDGWVCLGA